MGPSKCFDASADRVQNAKGRGWCLLVTLFWVTFSVAWMPWELMFIVRTSHWMVMLSMGLPLERPNMARGYGTWRVGIGPVALRVYWA